MGGDYRAVTRELASMSEERSEGCVRCRSLFRWDRNAERRATLACTSGHGARGEVGTKDGEKELDRHIPPVPIFLNEALAYHWRNWLGSMQKTAYGLGCSSG
jgi:hypothetical protein